MSENQIKIEYKIYLEAEDINQSRILSTTSYFTNLFANCKNTYFHQVEIDNENDMDDFVVRLYAESKVEEAVCSSEEDAKNFVADMGQFLDTLAQAQSYLDMEGDFTFEYGEQKESYHFTSESGKCYCDFVENK